MINVSLTGRLAQCMKLALVLVQAGECLCWECKGILCLDEAGNVRGFYV